jgi:hypothetical protein
LLGARAAEHLRRELRSIAAEFRLEASLIEIPLFVSHRGDLYPSHLLPLCVGNVRDGGIAEASRRAHVASVLTAPPASADSDRGAVARAPPGRGRRRSDRPT